MNIKLGSFTHPINPGSVFCPGCHSNHCRKHAVYTRKWFHVCTLVISVPIVVQRYRCLNPDCPRCTFSILPPMVLRYCRFFWPCLLTLKGIVQQHILRRRWDISDKVALRAIDMVKTLTSWVEQLYREVSDGDTVRELGRMVKIIVGKIGHVELSNRWYRHRYPLRFADAGIHSHNLFLVNNPAKL